MIAADHLERQPFGRRIDREHASLRAIAVVLVAEVDELARLELAAVEEAHGAGQRAARRPSAIVRSRNGWPGHDTSIIPVSSCTHRLEDPQPLPRREHALRDDAADDRAVHPRLERRDRRDGARVLVAVRDVVEQIARGDDAEPLERLGARRPDALEVGDRRVEPEARLPRGVALHSSPSSSCANSAASNDEQIVARLADAEELDRHVERLVHGDDDAAARRAVELRHDEPVIGTAAANVFACCDRVLADRAVEHEQRLVRRVGHALGDDARDLLQLRPSARRSCAGGRPCR